MKKIIKRITAILERVPIASYVLVSLLKSFAIAVGAIAVVFLILWATGIYATLETALDLKYNSPIVLAPMWVFAALFVLCFTVGFLLYFHKYKRGKSRSEFHKALAPVLDKDANGKK